MSTKAQRARVIRALECLANQDQWKLLTSDVLGDYSADDRFACAAYGWASRARAEAPEQYEYDADGWRYLYAEAAQLIREGSIK